MTLDALISTLLNRIFREHYGPARGREYLRDQRALTQAIARYGHVCAERGWHFEEAAIFCDISRILDNVRTAKADIKYLPAYLEGAIDRHCRLRAEELSEEAKRLRQPLRKVQSNLPSPVQVVIHQPVVEVLDGLWRDLKRRQRRTRAERSAQAAAAKAQADLFASASPKRPRATAGHSLIETLTAVAIIALLVSILSPSILRAARVSAARADWTAFWHAAQATQTAATEGEWTPYWQMTPDDAFRRLYVQRGIRWHQVDAGLRRQWRQSTAALASDTHAQ